MILEASSHPRGLPYVLSFFRRGREREIRSGEGEAGFAGEFPIPAKSRSLTGMDSFISISGTFPFSWFSQTSSEEGESKRRSSGIFRRGLGVFRPPVKASECL
ncbi:PREDICTED: uncharacterized protein LOC101296338 [Fragaria vesca subsp. vesca]